MILINSNSDENLPAATKNTLLYLRSSIFNTHSLPPPPFLFWMIIKSLISTGGISIYFFIISAYERAMLVFLSRTFPWGVSI